MNESATALCAACNVPGPIDVETCAACGEPALLRARYRLLSIVGQGAAGITYRADDTQSGDTVAVKEIPLRHTTSVEARRRIEREARVLRELAHARIPRHVDQFVAGAGKQRTFYLVQGFVEGQTLRQEIERKRYTEPEVLATLDQVLEVLEYLHGLAPPVIHRDIKPGNIVREADGGVSLIDFGAVRDVLRDPKLGGSTVAGTYGYMAPEQFKGEASPRTDLYAVGVLGAVMLSRREPLEMMGPSHALDWEGHVHGSEPTKALLRRLLKGDPRERPASAARVREEIDRILNPPAHVERTRPDPRSPFDVTRNLPEPVPEPGQLMWRKGRKNPVPITSRVRREMGARNRGTAIVLALVGGFVGLHHWYLKRPLMGVLSAVFSWTFIPTLVSTVQGLQMAFDSDAEFDRKYNPELLELARTDTREIASQIRELHQLVQDGALSQEEFEREKKRILGDQEGGELVQQFDQPAIGRLFQHIDKLSDLPELLLDELKKAHKRNKKKGRWRR